MVYTIEGRVCARPCEGLEVPISNGTVLFYTTGEDSENRREIDGTDEQLHENGEFEPVEIPEYVEPGQPVFVDVRIESPCAEDEAEAERTQATVATLEFAEQGESREIERCLTPDEYCEIMQELGCWYVCGQITDCETGRALDKLDVAVYDADIVQPDPLGTDTTDANGWYLIYYTRPTFEVTPAQFAPIELIGGPDLFFEVSFGGNTLLDEDQSDGRQSDREDADHCEHIDLCVDFEDGRSIAAAWLRVGQYAIPDSNSLKDFDTDGYTDSKKYAFYGTLPLEGSIPVQNVPIRGAGGNPVRYRFKVGPSQLQNGTQGTASQSYQIVDDGNDLFSGVHVGTLVYVTRNQFDLIRVRVEPGDLNNGWVRIDDAIRDAYQTAQNNSSTASPIAALGSYQWAPTGQLAGLDTTELTTETMPSAPDPGKPVPGSPPVDDEEFAIQFELQEQVGSTWQTLPADGTTLNRIVVNNNGEIRTFDLVQLEADPCKDITPDNVDLTYTLYHPHLEGGELEIRRNDQTTWTTLSDPDPATELSFFNVSSTDSKFDHNYNDQFDISGHVDQECAYMVRFRSRRRLTTGRSTDGWNDDLLAFCPRKESDEDEDEET